MSVIKAEPIYVCDLCGRRPLVYKSTSRRTGQKWGIGIHVNVSLKPGEATTINSDNLSNTPKHLCSDCLKEIRRIAEGLANRGHFD